MVILFSFLKFTTLHRHISEGQLKVRCQLLSTKFYARHRIFVRYIYIFKAWAMFLITLVKHPYKSFSLQAP